MKKVYSLFLILLPFISISQQDLEYFDPKETLDIIVEQYSNAEYDEALELIAKIDVNDSLYNTYYFIKTSIYSQQENYEEVIKLCDGAEKFTSRDLTYRIKKGVALLRLERNEDAKKYFDEIIDIYPVSYIAYYNRGVANAQLDDYENAIKDYQQAIILNPYYQSSHYELGMICYTEHLMSQAMLCFNTYLLIEPTSDGALEVLSLLNTMVSEKNENEKRGITISEDDEAFEEIDLLISNYTALNKKYKISNDIKLSLVKQNHALMEMLQNFEGNGGFWDKKYVPIYKEIFNSGNFDPFIYFIMSSTTNEKYVKILKKRQKGDDDFVEWIGPFWKSNLGKDNPYKGKEGYTYTYHDDGECAGIGKKDEAGEYIDEWNYFTDKGKLRTVGKYKNGERYGDWTWYFPNGEIDEKLPYVEGEPEGIHLEYNEEGYLVGKTEYKNGKINGEEINYSDYGVKEESITRIDDKSNGMSYYYHDLGDGFIATEIPLTDGEIDGVARTFYSNEQVKLKVEIRDDKRIGEEFHYYQNGQLMKMYTYVDGEISGGFKQYFDTGKLMEEGQFAKDNRIGEWKTYYSNGSIENTIQYNDKGKYQGAYVLFHPNGKQASSYNYNNGKFLSCQFFDNEGKLIKGIKSNNRSYQFEGYYMNGNISSKGEYQDNDDKEGEWNYYNKYGQHTSKEMFKDGLLTGIDYNYYPDGSTEISTMYEDGKVNGEHKTYYSNGTLKSQGFYKDGDSERIWLNYYPDGTLSERYFYKHDNLDGYQFHYSVEGKLHTKQYWKNTEHLYTIFYDTSGAESEKISYYIDSVARVHYPNGNIRRLSHYKNSVSHGEFTWYFINGQIETVGKYFDGEREGKWLWYFDDGTINIEGNYVAGKREGKWNTFYENGKLSILKNYVRGNLQGEYFSYSEEGLLDFETNYYEGNLHGTSKFYSDQEELQGVRFYQYGILTGYSYPDENGELLPEIILKDGTGKVTTYYSNRTKSREYEVYKGKLNGEYFTYHSNGELAAISTHIYGERQGKTEDYYENGQIKVIKNYLNDEYHGDLIKYFPSGQIKEKSNYKNGESSGWSETYTEAGKLKKKIFYFNGQVYDAEYYD